MSHVINMHRPGDTRQTATIDLPKVIRCLVAPRFEHSTLVVRTKQHDYSAVAAKTKSPVRVRMPNSVWPMSNKSSPDLNSESLDPTNYIFLPLSHTSLTASLLVL